MQFYSLIIGKETWRSVPSSPGILASSKGRILTPPRERVTPSGGKYLSYGKPHYGKITKARGMLRYTAYFQEKTKLVSRLVCEAFNGPAPKEKPLCLHLDENSLNNLPDNLSWGTQTQNMNAPKYRKLKSDLSSGDLNPNYRHGGRCRGVKRKY
jgi:hypothetical protein